MRHPARPLPLACLLALPLLIALGLRPAAAAEPPRVVASIGPLQGLAAMVAGDVAEPALLIPGNASPHSYSLRPSEARLLAEADLVIWIGPALESFLAEPLDNLAADARRLTVTELPGLVRLPVRRGGVWGEHDHDDGHGHGEHAHDKEHDHEEHAHDEAHGHGEHAHDEAHGHEEHAHDEAHGHGEHAHDEAHDHSDAALDPHLWLDPANAMVIVDAIAAALAEIDPDHAAAYRENAQAAQVRLAALDAALARTLAPVADKPFVVFHDAYQHLEQRYGLAAVGAVTVSPDIQPGARRLGELREEIARRNAVCIFAEPQFPPRVIELIAGESGARVGVLDPLGADIEPGPEAYLALMERLGAVTAECLAGPA